MRIRGASVLLAFAAATALAQAQEYVISTYAGGVPPPTPAAAINMSIGPAQTIASDAAGNTYFVSLNCIFRLDQAGTVTRIAGTSRPGYSGDGGLATSAQLRLENTPIGFVGFLPPGLAVDRRGNIFVADNGNVRIRKISADGVVTTVAGNGNAGFSGDGGLATDAQISSVFGLAVDPSGNLWISDCFNNRIRQVTTDGVITTVAGDGSCGFSGDGGAAAAARLCGPTGMAIDRAGNLVVVDTGNNRIRKISPDGSIATVAGMGPEFDITTTNFSAIPCVPGNDGGPATSAGLCMPTNVAVEGAGSLFIADGVFNAVFELDGISGQAVRKVSAGGIITTVTGQGCAGNLFFSDSCYDGTTAARTLLQGPLGLAVDASDNRLLVVAGYSYRIRKLSSDGTFATVAGDGTPHLYSGDGGPAVSAQLSGPQGLAIDDVGNLFIADYANDRIRKVSPDGIITTVGGVGTWGSFGDGGQATRAQLAPANVAIDRAGNLFFFDVPNRSIRRVSPAGIITTIATVGGNNLYVAVDGAGNLFMACPADTLHSICKLSPDGDLRTAAAGLTSPLGIAVDSAGNLFIADTGANRIRKVTPDGIMTVVAGNGSRGYSGDGGPATEAQLSAPEVVAVDDAGNVFIGDYTSARIRRVSPDGIITTVAGNGTKGYSGDDGPATAASIVTPSGIAVDGAGNVYFAGAGAIRVLRPVMHMPCCRARRSAPSPTK